MHMVRYGTHGIKKWPCINPKFVEKETLSDFKGKQNRSSFYIALQQLTVSQIIEIIIYCPNVPLYINVVYAR